DALLDVLGSCARIEGDDADHRDVDVGKEIDREARRRHAAEDDEHERHHQDENRIPERQSREPHRRYFSGGRVARTAAPSEIESIPPVTTSSPAAAPCVISSQVPSSTPVVTSRRSTLSPFNAKT